MSSSAQDLKDNKSLHNNPLKPVASQPDKMAVGNKFTGFANWARDKFKKNN